GRRARHKTEYRQEGRSCFLSVRRVGLFSPFLCRKPQQQRDAARSRKFTPYKEGGALVLPQEQHELTRTYFRKGRTVAKEEADLSFPNTLAREIRDVRSLPDSNEATGHFTIVVFRTL